MPATDGQHIVVFIERLPAKPRKCPASGPAGQLRQLWAEERTSAATSRCPLTAIPAPSMRNW